MISLFLPERYHLEESPFELDWVTQLKVSVLVTVVTWRSLALRETAWVIFWDRC